MALNFLTDLESESLPQKQVDWMETVAAHNAGRAVTAFLAETRGYSTEGTPTPYVEGRVIQVGPHRYGVAASDADDAHVENAADTAVKFYVLPADPVTPAAFGATGAGVANDTVALKAFFDFCIAGGHFGYIPAGTYLVTLGQLAFDNDFVDTNWPNIDTAGFSHVTFKAASNADAAFISITNGTATSGVSNVWSGGRLGGITFEKATGDASAYTDMHGLVLRGVEKTHFGYMRASYLGGDTIHIPRALYNTNNPDPYNVSQCSFDGAEGNWNGGRAFMNDNYVGLAGCVIHQIRAIENVSGAFFGQGAANTVHSMSVGSCAGWAIGDQSDVAGGASTRFTLGSAEFDDVQYGIDTSIASNSDYGTHRFVHRHEFGPYNDDEGYWPRTALKIGNPSRNTTDLRFRTIDRIEAGGVKGDLGSFADFVSASGYLSECEIHRQVLDNAGFGIDSEDLYDNFNANSVVIYTSASKPVIDTRKSAKSSVTVRASGSIPNGGYTGASNNVPYSVFLKGNSTIYDTTDYIYTVPAVGRYRIRAAFGLTLTDGDRVRIGILLNGSVARAVYRYATSSNNEMYEINATLDLSSGDEIEISADNDSGSSATITSFGHANDNCLEIDMV